MYGPEVKKYGMPQLMGECSGKGEPTTTDRPPPYRPPPMANKEGMLSAGSPSLRRKAA